MNNFIKLHVERYRLYLLALGFSLIEYSIMVYAGRECKIFCVN